MSRIRKNWWSGIAAFIALTAMTFAALMSSAEPGGLKAEVSSVGDGTAKIIFKPNGSADHVTVNNIHGEAIGKLNWAASFEMSVTEDALRKATTKQGIDLNALLQGIGTVQSGDKTLVAAELPVAIQDLDGRELAAGTKVYFGLDRLAQKGVMAPVVAWGGRSMGPGGAANEFNDRLIEKGIKGRKRNSERPTPAATKATGASPHHQGYDEESRVGLDPINQLGLAGQQFLSSPTCMANSSQRMVTTSHYGPRRSFATDNGKRATSFHKGVDIAGRPGTPIVAAAAGSISIKDLSLDSSSTLGFSIMVDHGNGFTSQYSHMQNFSPKIREFIRNARPGQKFPIARGEPIGAVGATGNCTGPHLHFGLWHNGKSVNPRDYLLARSDGDYSQTCEQLAVNNEALKQKFGEGATAVAAVQTTGSDPTGSVSVAQSRSATVAQ